MAFVNNILEEWRGTKYYAAKFKAWKFSDWRRRRLYYPTERMVRKCPLQIRVWFWALLFIYNKAKCRYFNIPHSFNFHLYMYYAKNRGDYLHTQPI